MKIIIQGFFHQKKSKNLIIIMEIKKKFNNQNKILQKNNKFYKNKKRIFKGQMIRRNYKLKLKKLNK